MSPVQSITHTTPTFRNPPLRGEPQPEGFVDAVIAAGALAAWSDGKVHPVERLEMLVYMRRAGLAMLRRRDVLEIFDQRVRDLKHDPATAMQATRNLLGELSGSFLAWTVLRAAEHIAAADAHTQDSELMAIHTVRAALGLSTDRPEHSSFV